MRICVFCGSRAGHNTLYTDAAREMGTTVAARQMDLVYGGGRIGLMGVIADSVLGAGGVVIGVMPQDLVDREIQHTGLTELHVVSTMHERKTRMAELADGFIALPSATVPRWLKHSVSLCLRGVTTKPSGRAFRTSELLL